LGHAKIMVGTHHPNRKRRKKNEEGNIHLKGALWVPAHFYGGALKEGKRRRERQESFFKTPGRCFFFEPDWVNNRSAGTPAASNNAVQSQLISLLSRKGEVMIQNIGERTGNCESKREKRRGFRGFSNLKKKESEKKNP